MADKKFFVIDFDSTFTKVEALDILSDILYEGTDKKIEVGERIKDLTDQAMAGELSFREALEQRLALLEATKKDVSQLSDELKKLVSESVKRNREFFTKEKDNVLIVSSGFKDFITPVVKEYGIKEENIYANTFTYNDKDEVTGFDASNPLSEHKGKVKLMKELALDGDVYVIGDGYTDYEIREAGLAKTFFAFTENVKREKVLAKADVEASSFDEILYSIKHPMATSFPKSKIKVLLLENVHQDAKQKLEDEGYQVELLGGALDEDELCEKIKGVHILGIRSKTMLTRKVVEAADRLMIVGAFCIGTNQIDLDACTEHGVCVFNAPFSNTRSVVEMAIGEIILLMRQIPRRLRQMDRGEWSKSASGSFEVRGKKLGIIGYGNIGSQLSILAEMLGMDVYYYDVVEKLALGNATKLSSLDELLAISDVVSLHVDGRPENKRFFTGEHINKMKKGAILVNLARGPVVELDALQVALDSKHLAGAAIDVFPVEPKNNNDTFDAPVKGDNLILTPHIGGSTLEAQENIADFVPGKMIEYVNTGSSFNSVNFPNVQLPRLENGHRLLHIHKNVSGILAQMNNVFAKHGCNILGQYLKTNEEIGYVITDIDQSYNPELLEDMKAIDNTIKFRTLY
ncbi:phosphoglycerate dehydrogenase [Flammeovirga agarivorans]|uniref:D-3-phosphoglycerate dehydrogenase n=1 Tax=Flammeovirga agarivorans TaxID=2726742 RepID=A0A7X8SQ48_9BACT|nr:phosphoglycerate dehydrogenase [Flammeovirga agarivorans]NLR94238.1 phosphoglycerate dehydrogenase [Flammeovirga agarivorans]